MGRSVSFPIVDNWSGSATITKTFPGYMQWLWIKNDGASDLTFTVNGLTFILKAGETFDRQLQAFNTITITTTVAYRAMVGG